jgi:hypothetical protein
MESANNQAIQRGAGRLLSTADTLKLGNWGLVG